MMERDVLESAKLADRKLIFMPLLLFLGRFWGILRCCLAFSGHTSKSLHPGDKALQVLQVIYHDFLHSFSIYLSRFPSALPHFFAYIICFVSLSR